MAKTSVIELRRRPVTKSLIWRAIGVVWTWVGAYLILVLTPAKYRSASLMATAIVIYHHSTLMIMYYFYERVWSAIEWGKIDHARREQAAMSRTQWVKWAIAVIAALTIIFFLILYVIPLVEM